jgi:hypothetical protein
MLAFWHDKMQERQKKTQLLCNVLRFASILWFIIKSIIKLPASARGVPIGTFDCHENRKIKE